MRKLIEDLHISVNEKDAEIIKLRMHLGDERSKVTQIMRKQTSQNSIAITNNATSSPQTLQHNKHSIDSQSDVANTRALE